MVRTRSRSGARDQALAGPPPAVLPGESPRGHTAGVPAVPYASWGTVPLLHRGQVRHDPLDARQRRTSSTCSSRSRSSWPASVPREPAASSESPASCDSAVSCESAMTAGPPQPMMRSAPRRGGRLRRVMPRRGYQRATDCYATSWCRGAEDGATCLIHWSTSPSQASTTLVYDRRGPPVS